MLVGVLGLISASLIEAADPGLVGWWEFDGDSGGIAYDSSGNGNHGTLEGEASIIDDAERSKVLYLNGIDGYANIPNGPGFDITDLTLMFWMKLSTDFDANSELSMAPVGKTMNDDYSMEFTLVGTDNSKSPKGSMYLKLQGTAYCYAYTTNTFWAGSTWYHITGVYNQATLTTDIYVNGELGGTASLIEYIPGDPEFAFSALDVPLEIGRLVIEKAGNTMKYFDGCIDDVRLYSCVLTEQEIQQAMKGIPSVLAINPSPANEAIDVPRDAAVLTWKPGEKAFQHDVYVDPNFDDVNQATVNSAEYMGRQSETTYALERLDLGKTYYWRVDEVNSLEPDSPWKGEVWSFKVEPVAIPLSGHLINATASSMDSDDTGPSKTIDGSGLVGDAHSQELNDMWLSAEEANGAWIQYAFDKPYKIHVISVWNHNNELEKSVGFGIKDAAIAYSPDGEVWIELGVQELAQGAVTLVDLQDVTATAVRITAQSNWGGQFSQYGLSEVQFEYIPTYAREPEPASGSVVPPDTILGWRAGREAALHEVHIGTDASELTLADAVLDNNYDTTAFDLQLGKTYYWKINEVNETDIPMVWEGDLWEFSTPEFLVVDDFESYDVGNNEIWWVWKDGLGYVAHGTEPAYLGNGTGSAVGNETTASYTEETIVHGGGKSMPLFYDNNKQGYTNYSEATRTFDTPQDWTRSGVETLVLFFSGDPANTGGQLYLNINGDKVPFNGDAAAITRPWWTQWNIDLASSGVKNLHNVTTLSIGVEGAGSSGTLYIDDIRLYPSVPAFTEVVLWLEAESTASITEPMKVWPDMADTSGSQYIAATSGSISKDNPPTEGVATYTITVPGGTYRILGRVIAPGGGSDSFWVRIQGATIDRQTDASGWLHWSMENGSEWHWTAVNSYDAGSATVLFTMPTGTYTLEVAYREEGALLDAIVIVEDRTAPEPDVVLYEEAFPNGQGDYKPLAWVGWEGYVGSNAMEVTTTVPGDYNENNIIVDSEDDKAFHLKGNATFMFTEEPGVISQFDVREFSADIQKKDTPFRFAVRIDTNSTPGDTSDDAWFATDAGYIEGSQTTVTSAFTTAASDWRDLTLNPGVELSVAASARTENLPAGDITAYGIYGEANGDMRIYNYKVVSVIN